jgi:hypothetical protein
VPPPTFRDVVRDFSLGDATLDMLRSAARAESSDRQMANEILKLIADWERTPWTDSVVAKNELRARAKQLVPAAPPPGSRGRRDPNVDPATAMYEAGLRGQRRRR